MGNSLGNRQSADFAAHLPPFSGLAYRSLVFARQNGNTSLYFVAGASGGPWSAENALRKSHAVHGGPCFYCKKDMKKGEGTIDHVEPVKLGGKSTSHNLVIACKPCNPSKGHQVIDSFKPEAGKEWLEAVHRQIEQRLKAITPPSSPPPPSQDAAGGP